MVKKKVLLDAVVMQTLIDAMAEKKKFKIQINGIGGDWTNTNVQTKIKGINWIHLTIDNRKEPSGNF